MIYTKKLAEGSTNVVEDTYEVFWEHHKRDLGHYFRYLYNIFKFIDNSGIKDKLKYSNIVRAQISDHELSILFYNCISQYGKEKFKPLVEDFHLLDNLPKELILDENHHKYYDQKAFE